MVEKVTCTFHEFEYHWKLGFSLVSFPSQIVQALLCRKKVMLKFQIPIDLNATSKHSKSIVLQLGAEKKFQNISKATNVQQTNKN